MKKLRAYEIQGIPAIIRYKILCLLACLLPKNINIRIYRAIIFPVAKIGLTLREEHRLSTSKTTVLRKIYMFGPKRDEEMEGLKKTAK